MFERRVGGNPVSVPTGYERPGARVSFQGVIEIGRLLPQKGTGPRRRTVGRGAGVGPRHEVGKERVKGRQREETT